MQIRAPRKILAVKLRALGDTILMTAPLGELRRAYPNTEIHAAVSAPWVSILEKQDFRRSRSGRTIATKKKRPVRAPSHDLLLNSVKKNTIG